MLTLRLTNENWTDEKKNFFIFSSVRIGKNKKKDFFPRNLPAVEWKILSLSLYLFWHPLIRVHESGGCDVEGEILVYNVFELM